MDLFWEKPNWETEDKHLSALSMAPFIRKFPDLDIPKTPSLFILRGARQVGKSSWLKTLLSQYPEPTRAFYLSCENLEHFKELSAILSSIQNLRSLILLDEVSYVKDWTRSVKHEIDSGYQGTIIVTGSHAADLRLGADTLPGRFGDGREIFLRPMNFEEYLICRQQAAWPTEPRKEMLVNFFRSGGMPASVAESGPEGKLPQTALKTYLRWIEGDATRAGKNKAFLHGLMAQLAVIMGTPISLQTLAKKTEIASHHTVQDYIHFLEDSFALRTCYALDPNTGASRFRKEKKFYFTDPILYWVALHMGGMPLDQEWESQVAEMVGYEEIAKKLEIKNQALGYYASSAGEIDYFSPKRWAIELKWSEVAVNLSKAFHKIILPEKIVWTKNNFLADWPQGLY
jgi:predicted AAA+ superfamily ATPase